MYGTKSIRGLGEALIVVDGIPRSSGFDGSLFNFIEDMQLEEVDQITVLKDASSRMLYGAKADQGVILITTKRGIPYRRVVAVHSEKGIKTPVSYPNFLNSGDYMGYYNQALASDGLAPAFSQDVIAGTLNGANKIKYPDEDFYNSTYLKDFSTFHRLSTEASGGNDKAQYYSYVSWTRNSTLFKVGDSDKSGENKFNFRGNVDYKLNDWVSASLDAVVILSADRQPNGQDFWQAASTQLPNSFPVLIPVSEVGDPVVAESAEIIDGKYILGGTNQFRNNIYGNFAMGGHKVIQQRTAQVNTGLNFNFDKLVKGLSAKTHFSYDMLNEYQISYNNQYAVYERSYGPNDSLIVTQYGNNQRTNSQTLSNGAAERRLGIFATMDYQRVFNEKHDVSASALGYWRNTHLVGERFSERNNHFGLRASYMYNKRYLAEFNGAMVGSGRLIPDSRYVLAPSMSMGWIMSEEDFLSDNKLVNFLKLKASFGSTKTDLGFPGYFVYSSTYTGGETFNYNQRSGNGVKVRLFQNLGNPNITLVSRDDLNIGIETQLADNRIWFEGNYFFSKSRGNIVKKNALTPDYLGGLLAYENYEDFSDSGFDLMLNYQDKLGAISYQLGFNVVYTLPKAVKIDELVNADAPLLQKQGKPYDAIFGYVAEGLFKDSTEIIGHPQQTFGTVRPGDIKYSDLNNDGIINENDRQIIGNTRPRTQYGVNLTVSYKNWSIFALGTAQTGGEKTFNSPYYWVTGNDAKYSEVVLDSWSPTNTDGKYPRLTTGSGSNNFRTSTYWLEKNNWFTIHTAQLTYNLKGAQGSVVREMNVYLRGNNLATFSKIKDKMELNIGSAPQMRTFSLGIDLSF
jgi:TonB-linked SusC/RagA family outer membrane protein